MRSSTFKKTAQYALQTLLLICVPWLTHAEDALETKVKSAYVFHLISFVEWEQLPSDAFHVCVLGASSIGVMLTELSNRQVKNLPLKIDVNNIENHIVDCQVLFIGKDMGNWRDILNKLHNEDVLTVSDITDFAQHGGMIGFYDVEGKTKLELNPTITKAANLKISAKLMELARIVSQ